MLLAKSIVSVLTRPYRVATILSTRRCLSSSTPPPPPPPRFDRNSRQSKQMSQPTHRNKESVDSRIYSLRSQSSSLSRTDLEWLFSVVTDRSQRLSEKLLCLTLSLLLHPKQFVFARGVEGFSEALASLRERILTSRLSLQGCNQCLGAFTKLSTQVSSNEQAIVESREFCQSVLDKFLLEFLPQCPRRELSNIFWSASVLDLDTAAGTAGLESMVISTLPAMDCFDLSVVCAGLLDRPHSPVWLHVKSELLSRTEFTSRDIPSIICSLVGAGMVDRELILHIVSVVLRQNLLSAQNVAPIVWAVATADAVHYPLLDRAVDMILSRGGREWTPIDVRRISRGFAVAGQLERIESWLLPHAISETPTEGLTDTVLIWELVTNGLHSSAARVFHAKPLESWKEIVHDNACYQSQLYHLYLASLVNDSLGLQPDELVYLESLQSSFSATTEDMSSSVLHRRASQTLAMLNYEHVSEFKEPKTGFIVDSYIPSLSMAVEVQGPTHFVTDLETGASILRPADAFKHQALLHVAGIGTVQATPWNFGPKLQTKDVTLMKAIIEGRPPMSSNRAHGGNSPKKPKQARPSKAAKPAKVKPGK